MKVGANPGMMLLGIWLILANGLPLLNIQFDGDRQLLAILAIAAGVMLLKNK